MNDRDKKLEISEQRMVYINELNSSQEAVLSAIERLDELVIQGPPGTGKFQTITSLIADFVSNGKTVLMVSEKKTALDVVYSRLGNLSQYALLIDDVGNKDAFYQQLMKMVSLGRWSKTESLELKELSSNIDSLVLRLEEIADKLYAPNGFGIEPYKLYILNKKIDLSDEHQKNKVLMISRQRANSLLNCTYGQLESMRNMFSDVTIGEKMEEFVGICKVYPWMSSVRGNMSDYDVVVFLEKLKVLQSEIHEWKSKNVIVRFFTKRKLVKKVVDILNEYFSDAEKDKVILFLEQIEVIIKGVESSYVAY